MGEFDDYRNRLTQYGGSSAQSFDNDTANFVNQTFANSPSYVQSLTVGTQQMDARVIRTQNPHEKKVLLRPSTIVHEGDLMVYNGDNWLIEKFQPHPMFPHAQAVQCNESIRWYDSNKVSHSVPCVLMSLHREVTIQQDVADLVTKSQMRVHAQSSAVTGVIKSTRLIFGSSVYFVTAVDDVSSVYDGYGITEFQLESTQFNTADDLVNKIADNTQLWLQESGESNGGVVTW